MAGADAGWERVLASLAEASGAASPLDLRRNAALVWSAAVDRLLWASADVLPAGWISATGDVADMPPALVARLRSLSSGLAPTDGFRLERLRLDDGLAPPTTIACRRLQESGALLTLLLGREASSAGEAVPDRQGIRPPADLPDPHIEPHADGAARRYTWQADAEGRFTAVSGSLPELFGADGILLLGRTWRELLGERVLDEGGAVVAAMDAARSWTRAPVGWRVGAVGRMVPVLLSGVPTRSPDGTVAGWRGFGLAYPDAERDLPAGFRWMVAPPPPEPLHAVDEPDKPSPGPSLEPILEEAMGAAAALTSSAGDAVFGVIRALLGSKREVADPGALEEAPSPAPAGLSGLERGALHEIARALGGRVEGEPEPGRPTAEIVPMPVRPRDPDPGGLLDRVPIGIVVLRDGLPLFANRHLLDLLDGSDLPALVARGSLQPILEAAARYGEPGRATAVTLPGTQAMCRVSVAPVNWGELPASLVALLPIEALGVSDRARDEVRALALDLSHRDERLGELRRGLDLAADGAATLDASARILWLSPAAEDLFGYTAAELAGDSVVALLPAADHRAALGCLEELRGEAPETVRTIEIRLRSAAGGSRPLAMRAARIPGRDPGGFVVTFHNLSRVKALEEELRLTRQGAERSSANQADFLARVSHEIRTPITAITGFAELMLEERFGPIGNERYRGYVRDIHGSGEHIVSLVNDLLDLAKVTAGKTDLTPAHVDLNAVVQQCVGLAMPLSTRERTIVRTSFPADLPRIIADERSVRQVALNILSNAIRYTGPGGQVIVATRVGAPGEIVLAVRDTGPGMEPDEIEAALQPFQQVAHTRRLDGTGLGLPLSKALVEANGGAFKVTSSRATGTLVEIRFPSAPPPRPETMAAE